MGWFIARIVCYGLLLGLAACGNDSSGNGPNGPSPVVASMTVLPAVDSIIIGDTARFQAEVRDSAGGLITDRTVTWSFPVVALPFKVPKMTVDQSGLVTAIALGFMFNNRTNLIATIDGVADTADIFLVAGPLYRIVVGPAFADQPIAPGVTATFVATALDSFHNGISGIVTEWSVTGPATLTPLSFETDILGNTRADLTPTASGTVTMQAAAEGKTGELTVTVP